MTLLYQDENLLPKPNYTVSITRLPSKKALPKNWKPISLRYPILGSVILCCLTVIILLELLAHISAGNGNQNGGGLAFGADVNSLPKLQSLLYLSFPTVISVIFSMVWSWIDLDAKRIEPWFQLSKPGGAKSEDSLLLQYPFDFLPFIPISAFRRKHWGVFLSGTIMLMIFWIITPFQSAIFNTGTVTRTIQTNIGTSAELVPITSQTTSLNANFLNNAYGISWLGQKPSPFTTREYAILPFQPVNRTEEVFPSETWTARTSIYGTNLTCTPADFSNQSLTYTFDNRRGCVVPEIALPDTGSGFPQPDGTNKLSDYMMLYVGYYNDPNLDYFLENDNCSSQFSNNFLALWAPASSRIARGVYTNLTAVFCETSYYTQEAYVTVNASDSSVNGATPIGNRSALPPNFFNTSLFEYISGVGINPDDQKSNIQDSSILQQFPRLDQYNISWPVTNMLGFAIALKTASMDELSQPAILQQTFQRAHQLLFSTAINVLTTPLETPSPGSVQAGVIHSQPAAIIMVTSVARIVEVALGIIIVMITCLWYYTYRRPSHMVADPASIADIMSLIQNDGTLLQQLNCTDTPTPKELSAAISEHKFILKSGGWHNDPSLELVSQIERDGSVSIDLPYKGSISSTASEAFVPVRPLELRLPFGISLISIILLVLAAIISLDIWSQQHDGISLPSTNTIVLSILENYLPTAFSTLLEPAWVLLNRLLCLLQPFEELRKGGAKASSSVKISYSSLPPQLVIWKAVIAGHLLLASVCMVTLLTNVLAVSLSSLLNEGSAVLSLPFNTSSTLQPLFDITPITNDLIRSLITYQDHFYVTLSNLTDNTTLPSWVDQKYYYLPFNIPSLPQTGESSSTSQIQGYKGVTTGFGASVNCVQLIPGNSGDSVNFKSSADGFSALFSTSHLLENGTTVNCIPLQDQPSTNISTGFNGILPSGPLALEAMQFMYPVPGVNDGGFCTSLMVAGWARSATVPSSKNRDSFDPNVTSLFIGCTPKVQAGTFEVMVDAEGHVLNSTLAGDLSTNVKAYFSTGTNETSLLQQTSSLIAPGEMLGDLVWHNDSFTSDWMNSLMGIVLDTGDLVNPSAPVPDSKDVIPALEELYARLFAVLLGLNTQVFTPAPNTTAPVEAYIIVQTSRLFVSSVAFKVSVAILALHLIVSILYYANRPRRFLPRMPTSIASIIAYVGASRALEDFGSDKNPKQSEHRYGYGRFIGTDGKTHVGIERQRYVVPLKSRNPAVKPRRFWKFGKETDETQPKSWI